MIFASPLFLFAFLPAALALYYLAPQQGLRNFILLLLSIFFYAWGEPLLWLVMLAGCLFDYGLSRFVLAPSGVSPIWRKTGLVIGVSVSAAMLVYFKYANFFIAQASDVMIWAGGPALTPASIVLPLGISFFTFHRISFLVDIYRRKVAMPAHLGDYLLYMLLFPQMIAGPIIRYHQIDRQIIWRSHSAQRLRSGFLRFSVGLAKKLVIADPCGRVAEAIFNLNPESLPPSYLWIGVVAYSIQIYFDFSGYSDMGIGLAKMLGFRFPENFLYPYTSRSITEFWRRWHRTLSGWMWLYLYLPLGGNRLSPWKTYRNLWIVFLFSGFWHGANWTFVLWGAYYGLLLSIERLFGLDRGRSGESHPFSPTALLRQWFTLLLVMIGWVFFRAGSVTQAIHILIGMSGLGAPVPIEDYRPIFLQFDPFDLIILSLAFFLVLLPRAVWRYLKYTMLTYRHVAMRPAAELGLAVGLVLLGVAFLMGSGFMAFLYFRF
jgi:alginate O-acetyltransferase complex protein AlgI